MSKTIYVTFGVQYSREAHPRLWFAHPDGYLTVEAPDDSSARDAAFALTGGAHCTDYPDPPSEWCPRGELARLIVHDAVVQEPA